MTRLTSTSREIYLELKMNKPSSYRSQRLRLWVILNRLVHSIARASEADLRSRGITSREFSVLELLLHKAPLSIGEVAERVLLQSGSTTYVVDKLEKKGLLQRVQSCSDARCFYLELTKEGKKVTQRILDPHTIYMDQLLSSVTEVEAQQLADLLKKIGLSLKNEKSF